MTDEILKEFKDCLFQVSYARAGWDYQLPPDQKAKEAEGQKRGLDRAREIWRDYPDLHDQLERVFNDYNPLMILDEVKRSV